jgi:hypothetical protein
MAARIESTVISELAATDPAALFYGSLVPP